MVDVKVKKVVGYVRVSSESQIDNTSIENQIDKINLYCQLRNLELVKLFSDEGETGSKTDKRKGYNDMIEYINNNDIDAIIVNKIDRIHRSGKNLLIMVEDILEPLNIAFISINEQFDTSSAQGKLFLTMLGGFAEFERKVINERTKSGRVKKGNNSKFAGGRVPYGYKLVNSDELIINESEAKVIKTIFELRKEGKAINKIVSYLNDNNITINDKAWSNSKLDYILKNEIYTGVYSYDGIKEENDISFKVPRIISKQLWNKVNN